MVNSAIGDHGNEKAPYLPCPTSSTHLSLSPLYCMIYCVCSRTVVCARPGQTHTKKKDRTRSCNPAKDPNSKLSVWHSATYFSHSWCTFCFVVCVSSIHTRLVCLFFDLTTIIPWRRLHRTALWMHPQTSFEFFLGAADLQKLNKNLHFKAE